VAVAVALAAMAQVVLPELLVLALLTALLEHRLLGQQVAREM
jgi:hypothetical protein